MRHREVGKSQTRPCRQSRSDTVLSQTHSHCEVACRGALRTSTLGGRRPVERTRSCGVGGRGPLAGVEASATRRGAVAGSGCQDEPPAGGFWYRSATGGPGRLQPALRAIGRAVRRGGRGRAPVRRALLSLGAAEVVHPADGASQDRQPPESASPDVVLWHAPADTENPHAVHRGRRVWALRCLLAVLARACRTRPGRRPQPVIAAARRHIRSRATGDQAASQLAAARGRDDATSAKPALVWGARACA